MGKRSFLSFIFISILVLAGCSKKSSDPVMVDLPSDPPSNNTSYWKSLPVPSSVNSAAIDPSGNIWAGTNSGVYRSADGGTSWEKISNAGLTTTTKAALVRSDASGKIYALVGTDVYSYNPSGSSWTNISQKMNNSLLTFDHAYTFSLDKSGNIFMSCYAAKKLDPQTIAIESPALYKSSDGGQTWSEIKVNQFMGKIVDIAVDSNNKIYVVMDANIYHSYDSGRTWEKASGGLVPANPFLVSVNSKNVVYSGTGSGLYLSSDSGVNWSNGNWTTYCISLGINSKDYIFVGAINKCFLSKDNAKTWTDISSGLSYSLGGFSDCVMQGFDKNGYAYSILESVLYKSVSVTY